MSIGLSRPSVTNRTRVVVLLVGHPTGASFPAFCGESLYSIRDCLSLSRRCSDRTTKRPVGNWHHHRSYPQMKFTALAALAHFAAISGHSLGPKMQAASAQEISPPEQDAIVQTQASPRRLMINVAVADPSDLKVGQGEYLQPGQLIADRGRDRQRLEAQKRYLELTLQRIEETPISAPLSPQKRAVIIEPTYLEEQAAIDRAKALVDQAEAMIEAKRQEIGYLGELANLDPLVMEHEQAKLAELQNAHTAAVRDYQLAAGKRSTAEYDHSIRMAEDDSSRNYEMLTYQRQVAEYEQRLRDRDYRYSQTQLSLDEVENAIATLAVVKSPYAGRVRRVKWTGQSADGMLSAEITLMVRGDASASSGDDVSEQQP